MANNATPLSIPAYGNRFAGVSSLLFKAGNAFPAANADWDFNLPLSRDSFSYDGGETSFDKNYVHGVQAPWTAVLGTPGDTSLSFELPAFDEALMAWGFTAAGEAETVAIKADTLPSGKAKTLTLKPYSTATKIIKGTILVIDEAEENVFATKWFKGTARLVVDGNGLGRIAVTGTVEASTDKKDLYIGTAVDAA